MCVLETVSEQKMRSVIRSRIKTVIGNNAKIEQVHSLPIFHLSKTFHESWPGSF